MRIPGLFMFLFLVLQTSSGQAAEFQELKVVSQTKDPLSKIAFFESNIRPLFLKHCIECHGEKKQKGGLRLDSRIGWQKGGDSGPALVPGMAEKSLLIKAVRHLDNELKMPPQKQLTPGEVNLLVDWINQGAVDPREDSRAISKTELDPWPAQFKKRLDWWSLKPLGTYAPPTVKDSKPEQDPVDRFIQDRLEPAKIKPATQASTEILLRRLSFVLTGLPPTTALRTKFLKNNQIDADQAYSSLVEELLESPHFGERFARHWMDVVRYTDTYGYEWDNPAKGSHEYRDYLIRAFNKDLPFDQFLREQLAGDLLPQPRIDTDLGINESLIGPMFYHMGEHRHGSSLAFNGVHQEMVNNKIEAFSKVFLALTVACARCHDHKLEPVSQRDYYALGAMFMTPRWTSRPVDSPGKNDEAISRLKEIRSAIRAEISAMWRTAVAKPDPFPIQSLRLILQKKDPPKPLVEQIEYQLGQLFQSESDPESRWKNVATEWQTVRNQRLKANESFKILTDFSQPGFPKGWVTDGDGMRSGFVEDATPLIALEGPGVIARLLPRGYHTHALSSRLPGALRIPPQHEIPGKILSVKLAGGQFGGYLQEHENAFQGEEVTFLNNIHPEWRSFADIPLVNGITRITYEFATSSLNPNFPPRTGLAAGLANNDFGFDKRSWLSITQIVSHDGGGAPLDILDSFASLFQGAAPKTIEERNLRIQRWLADTVNRWCDGRVQPGDQPVIDWLLSHQLLANGAPAGSSLAMKLSQYRKIEQTIPFPRTVNSMDERETPRARYAFNIRGNVDAIGEMVPPDFLQMFAGSNEVAKSKGSGRLELANSLTNPDHPLTTRVYVNRVWQWVFGTGIVATPDDFGHLGEKPSHPELLDFLAREFVREGWSTKKLIRRLVNSQTFRQGGTVSNEGKLQDPDNRLMHHFPTRRLEGEAIRDNLLAVSGRLDPILFGRPIFPPRVAEDGSKRLFAGPLDGDGRRSIYLQMSIMEPPRFLVGFNLPDLRLPTGRRDTTNVPSQALILLNDPFVWSMAKHWARKLVNTAHQNEKDRIQSMFLTAFAREPSNNELNLWITALKDFASPDNRDILKDEAAWAQLAHALFNTKEFIHYR